MKKTVVLSLSLISLVSLLSGFALSRSSKSVSIKIHIKDLPQHNLRLIAPSDPSFDERFRKELKGESNELVDIVKPFSVFFENKGERPVVAYLVQWCFTRADGSNQYQRTAILNPQALMEGENLSLELSRQSGRIEPDSATFISLVSIDGSGILRAEVTAKEAEEFRQGKPVDHTSLLQRFAQAAEYAEITVSIDGAFFDDGVFVGPDTSNFFAQTKAAIDARHDLLSEIAISLPNSAITTDSLYRRIQVTAAQTSEPVDSESTPTDYYNYFKKFYASDLLQTTKLHGQEKTLAMAVQSINKPWARLRKKQD